jgi:hypothetical protein
LTIQQLYIKFGDRIALDIGVQKKANSDAAAKAHFKNNLIF